MITKTLLITLWVISGFAIVIVGGIPERCDHYILYAIYMGIWLCKTRTRHPYGDFSFCCKYSHFTRHAASRHLSFSHYPHYKPYSQVLLKGTSYLSIESNTISLKEESPSVVSFIFTTDISFLNTSGIFTKSFMVVTKVASTDFAPFINF